MTETLELKIEKIVPGGYGLGYALGLPVFVPLTAEGDTVKVRVLRRNEKFLKAEVIEVLQGSSYRQDPFCSYFGVCGGCDFQHLKYEYQLRIKIEIIRDCLRRIAGIDCKDDIKIISSPQSEYRLRAEWHVRNGKIGYFRRESNDLIEISFCPILSHRLQQFLSEVRLGQRYKEVEKTSIEVVTNGAQVSVFSDIEKDSSDLRIVVGEDFYFLNARLFFQANRFLLNCLIEEVVGDYKGSTCLDLYCGVGFFTIPLARRFEKVLAVEQMVEAVRYAKRNAQAAGLRNIAFFAQGTKDFLNRNLPRFDLVVLDPPRTGAERQVMDRLFALEPSQICYVSCDPATLARDLCRLVSKYEVFSVTAIDLFPQTHHVETIVKLRKI